MALKRANIFVSGSVQMAGFRGFVKELAESLEIKGYADNLPDGRVKIVCEGEEESILKLKTSLKENPPPFSNVENTEIEFSAFKGEFTTFERKGADIIEESEDNTALLKKMVGYMKTFVDKSEVVNQRLGDVKVGLGEIKVSVDNMHVTLKSVKEDTSAMLEKQDKMLEKQDATIDILKSVKEDTAQIPKILEHTSCIPRIVENTSIIPAMREDTSEIKQNTREIVDKLWNKHEEISKEIAEMKITLSRIEAKVFG
jgi:acylphosphatase